MNKILITLAAALSLSTLPSTSAEPLGELIQPVDHAKVLKDPDWFIWGGSLCKDDQGTYHLLYARWPKKSTFLGWLTHSEIARATCDSPHGPFIHQDTILPARDPKFWDGSATHNPTVKRFKGKYYLYHIGNSGNGKVTRGYNFSHRNSNRIGVAVADHPSGPWKRFDTPLLDVSDDPKAPDALCVNNPAVAEMPDGRYLMIYKAVARQKPLPFGGPVYHMAAIAEKPEGPFVKQARAHLPLREIRLPRRGPLYLA